MEQKEKLCDEVKTVSKFKYNLGDWVSAGGGCEAALIRCRCVKFRKWNDVFAKKKRDF